MSTAGPTRVRAPITFTIDVEDYAPPGQAVRAESIVHSVLDALDGLGARGTFFIVGELAQSHPAMTKAIADRGHELGLHGWRHVPLPELDPPTLKADLDRGIKVLEDLSGASVSGFRAPMFSLVPESRWAVEVVGDAGFIYSSSVLPARSPLWGDPTAARHPFRWPNGLIEFPCPVVSFGAVANPYLGGTYLRLLPLSLVRYGLAQAAGDEALWMYCHPYDFDPLEPFRSRPELGKMGSRVMWVGRSRMQRRVARILRGRVGAPLRERCEAVPS